MSKLAPRLAGGALFVAAVSGALLASATAPTGHFTIYTGTVYDNKTKLTWQGSASGGTFDLAGATNFCATSGSTWRLPTLKELVSLVDYTTPSMPTIDSTAFPSTPAQCFWTSTTYPGAANNAWFVNFDFGVNATTTVTGSACYARCVH